MAMLNNQWYGSYFCDDPRYLEVVGGDLPQEEPDETVYCECGEHAGVIEVHSYNGVEHFKDVMCKECYKEYKTTTCPQDGISITEVHWLD